MRTAQTQSVAPPGRLIPFAPLRRGRAALGLALVLLAAPAGLLASLLDVTPAMLSGNFTFMASPAISSFSSPIPYGLANNTADAGWIWVNGSYLVVRFPSPTALGRLRAYVTYAGGARGATWVIEASSDGTAYELVATFDFRSSAGGGVNDNGTVRADTAGWYSVTFNQSGAKSARYWRVRQTAVTNNHAPRVGQLQFHTAPLLGASPLPVSPSMLSGSLTFNSSSTPLPLSFGSPIPYGVTNNLNNVGWIWPNDNSGHLDLDFGAPTALGGFRAYATYSAAARGANWAIEYSTNQVAWSLATNFPFLTVPGGGINDDLTPRNDFAGWYESAFNPAQTIVARYWRVRQTSVLATSAPRSAQLQFHGLAPHPVTLLSALPQGGVKSDTNLVIQLQDGSSTQVDRDSIRLSLDGQAVVPQLEKPAGSAITTVTYRPPQPLAQGAHFYQVVFGDTAVPANFQTNTFSFVVVPDEMCLVTPDMLSGNFSFFVGPTLPANFSLPIPYGFENNTNDVGWIWTNNSYLVIRFPAPTALAKLRAYVVYPGGARGAVWAIDVSNDGSSFEPVSEWAFESSLGGGVNDDGSRRPDYAGWYEAMFNQDGAKAGLYWRVRQTGVTIQHTPRVAQLEFYTSAPLPSLRSYSPTGAMVPPNATVALELQDNFTVVAPATIALWLDGAPVTPSIQKPAGSSVTSVAYTPPSPLSWGMHEVRLVFANLADPPVWQTNLWSFRVAVAPLAVCSAMLSGPLHFLQAPPNTTFASPIPYGVTNNLNNYGWTWPDDNTGVLTVDFGVPAIVNAFRAYVTLPDQPRGASWAIEYSNDQLTWSSALDFPFVTAAGGGVNDDFTPRADFGGWYKAAFNSDQALAARFWRIRQTRVLAGHAPPCAQVEFYGSLLSPLPVTPDMLSGVSSFLAVTPLISGFADPIPYGIANNVTDLGWIWSRDNTASLQVSFTQPQVLNMFRAFCTYVGGERGAVWAVERSDDATAWILVTNMLYQSGSGAGLNDDGCKRAPGDYAGWYGYAFNFERAAALFWRIRQVEVTVDHAPRSAQVQFFEFPAPPPPLRVFISLEWGVPAISWADPFDNAVLQWADLPDGPWHDIPEAFSPHLVDPVEGAKFYRLAR